MSDQIVSAVSNEDRLILDEASERFERIQSDDTDNRNNYKADTLFVYSPGNQWPDEVRSARQAWKELCLEFNQLKQFVAQVVNDQRQNRPGIRIHPASGEASEETADILQGMIRNIEYESSAEAVYDNGYQCAVVGGRGAWRVCSEWTDAFNQKLVIKPINDMMTVYADLNYQQPDGADRNFVFVTCTYTQEEFKRKWPDASAVSFESLDSIWTSGNDIVVADYYRRVATKRTMVLMSDGTIGYKDEMPEPPAGITIMRTREVDDFRVDWFTIAGGQQILEKYEWPGTIIPVVIVPGEDMIMNGKRVYQGLIRHARDAQSMLNFGMTQQAIHLSLTPLAPWVMAEGQNEGYEEMWRDANTKKFSALIYKPVPIEGPNGTMLAPPPQRTAPSLPDAGWDRWCQMMLAMIKSTIGMYEQSLGQKGNEHSGKAIIAREKQGDTATFNFVDNQSRGIALTGKILVECMPTYYDTEQIVQTIGLDETRKLVRINQQMPSADGALNAIKENDISKGDYAVVCEAGPSYSTKRQETSDALMQLVQAFPPVAQVAGDLVVKSLDIADADVIAERLKLALPPAVQQAEAAKAQGQRPPDPQVMAQMQQKDQQLEQAVQTMHAMQAKIDELSSGAAQKARAMEIDGQFKEQQSEQDARASIAQAQLDASTTIEKARIEAAARIEVAKIVQQTDLMIAASKPAPSTPTEQ